jgi:hypothetical protein
MTIQQQIRKFNTVEIDAILSQLECPAELLTELKTAASDLAILQRLETEQLYSEAVKFLAHGLPKREAIWWAYLVSEAAEHHSTDPQTQEALSTIEHWAREPNEARRRQAGSVGEALRYYTPSSWAAMAILWSGGSITPEGRPPVEASPVMCAKAVSNAIIIGAHQLHATPPDEAFKRFLRQGLHIAMGGNGKITEFSPKTSNE